MKYIKILSIIFICISINSCESFIEAIASLGSSYSGTSSSLVDDSKNESSNKSSGTPIIVDKSSSNSTRINSPQTSSSNRRADPDASNWDIATLDTAKDVDYLTSVEKDVILEMNKVRVDPKKYAELYIKPTLKYYSGKNYNEPGQITLVTQEGVTAVNSCISALSKAAAVGLLQPEKGIWLAAKDHALDQSKTGKTGHTGNDKSDPFKRMERYGGGYNTAGENCAYGPNTGRDIVVQFLVDDGVPSRGHRTNIMNKSFTQTGLSVQTHPQFRYVCVIDYANGYTSK
jgi:uncharacterized protein YkwD